MSTEPKKYHSVQCFIQQLDEITAKIRTDQTMQVAPE